MSASMPEKWTTNHDLMVHFETQALAKACTYVCKRVIDNPTISSQSYEFYKAAANMARYFERRYELERDEVQLQEAFAWQAIAEEDLLKHGPEELLGE